MPEQPIDKRDERIEELEAEVADAREQFHNEKDRFTHTANRLLEYRAENERLHKGWLTQIEAHHHICSTLSQSEIDNAALTAELAEAREDATRYRWLRDPCSGAERIMNKRGDYGISLPCGIALDNAIDDATGGER